MVKTELVISGTNNNLGINIVNVHFVPYDTYAKEGVE